MTNIFLYTVNGVINAQNFNLNGNLHLYVVTEEVFSLDFSPKKTPSSSGSSKSREKVVYKKQGSLLPPPIHVGKHLRERQCDFHLSYDIWWQLINDLVKLNTPHHDGQIVALYAWPALSLHKFRLFYQKYYRGEKNREKDREGDGGRREWEDGQRWREIFENLV